MTNQTSQSPLPHSFLYGLIVGAVYLIFSFLLKDFCIPFVVMVALPLAMKVKTPFDRLIFSAIPLILSLFLGLGAVLQVAAMILTPCLVLGRLATEQNDAGDYYPFSRLVAGLGFYTLALGAVFLLFWRGFHGAEIMYSIVEAQLTALPLETQDQVTAFRAVMQTFWPYVPGLYGFTFIMLFSWGVSLAQGQGLRNLNATLFTVDPPKVMLSDLYVPWVFWQIFAGLGAGAVLCYLLSWTSILAIFGSFALIVLGVFVLQGLAIVTAFAKNQRNPKMFLVVFYGFVVVIVGIPISIIVISLFGLLEPWLDIRSKLRKKSS